MPTYVPPKKNTEYIFYIGLVDSANRPDLKANPTIASGDFRVSTDGGSFTNLDTLPTVTPASGVSVKVTVSATEMNGDNVVITASDPGGEWDDLLINIQTSTIQIGDSVDVGSINSSTTAAQNLSVSADTMEIGTAVAGTLSTSQMSTDITEATDHHFIGRSIIWTSGVLIKQASVITGYTGWDGSKSIITYETVTEAPSASDTFIIV